jgi:deazaflavin-dependent oxidoreductase (nitroreductase family)
MNRTAYRRRHDVPLLPERSTMTGRIRRGWLWFIQRTLNRVTSRIARSGRGPFSLVRHTGRRSGTVYETPLIVARVPEGFVAELTYGAGVNWYRNLIAARGGELLVGGVTHRVVAVESYPTDAGRRAFGVPARWVLAVLQRREFRLLRTA